MATQKRAVADPDRRTSGRGAVGMPAAGDSKRQQIRQRQQPAQIPQKIALTREFKVEVRPALCFVDAEWSLFAKPFDLGGVWIGWPRLSAN